METKAALLMTSPGKWEVTDVTLDEPQAGEVLIEMVAAGLCHSDDHFTTGDSHWELLPLCGGHEGSGIVRTVGAGVSELQEGDHVVTSFLPACGLCRWCAAGSQHLCDNGMFIATGSMLDGTYRMRHGDRPVAAMASVGSFSQWQVLSERSVVKISKDLPLDVAAIVSCGVPTGWGSATNAAQIEPGYTVIVMGCGGIGINAVQGAAHKGASHVVAVDPAPYKQEMALKLGATEAFSDIEEATAFVHSVTNGQGADAAIIAIGVTNGEHIGKAFRAIRKAGTVVVTGLGRSDEANIPVSLTELTLYQKRIQGCLYGNGSPRLQIPTLLALYQNGSLKLDELITQRYSLDQVNEGYADMHAGRNVRGLIDFSL